jgi:polar amino acid transport system substrate-binding protein
MTSCKKKNDERIFHALIITDFYPFSYNSIESINGLEIELISLIEKNINAKIEIHPASSVALLETFLRSEYDLAIGGITKTEIREDFFNFSTCYYEATQTIVSLINIDEIEELATKRPIRVGICNNTSSQYYLEEEYIKKKILDVTILKKFTSTRELIESLYNNGVELIILEYDIAKILLKNEEKAYFYKTDLIEEYGIIFHQNNDFEKLFNKALEMILNSTEWLKIKEKYLIDDYEEF